MNYLKKKILNYIRLKKDFFFTDHLKSYNSKEFQEKINFYLQNFEKLIKKNDSRGIAIILPRGVDYFACIFACCLSNCYFIPLKEQLLPSEKKYQIKISEACIVVKKKGNQIIFLKKKSKNLNPNNIEKLCYVIFTSGSTGPKKGVKITYKNFCSYLKSIKKISKSNFKFNSLLINGDITFDIVHADIAFALILNAEICITEDEKNIFSLIELLHRRKIESIYSVPSTWEKILYFLEKSNSSLKFVRQINSGGELLSSKIVTKMQKFFPKAKIFNFYGPTEFTINSTFIFINKNKIKHNHQIKDKENNITIGQPLPNINYKIEKKNKFDRYGELMLSGPQLMKGYINSSKNNFKFIGSKKYYLTGDLVYKKGRYLFFLGRNKDYVKVKGYRVNLTNISNIISNLIKKKTVVIISKKKLVAIIENNKKINLNKFPLKKKLQFWEIPSEFRFIKEIPKLNSGKINKNILC